MRCQAGSGDLDSSLLPPPPPPSPLRVGLIARADLAPLSLPPPPPLLLTEEVRDETVLEGKPMAAGVDWE